MMKFSCTMNGISDIYFATLIAQDPQQAKEMAIAEAGKRWGKRSTNPRHWSVSVLEPEVPGPARILECGHREA